MVARACQLIAVIAALCRADTPVTMSMCTVLHSQWCQRFHVCGRADKRHRKRACCLLCFRSPECTAKPLNFCDRVMPEGPPTTAAPTVPAFAVTAFAAQRGGNLLHGDAAAETAAMCATAPRGWCARSQLCTRTARLAAKRKCCARCRAQADCAAPRYCAKLGVDGGWGRWGPCTRKECGSGVQLRACDAPKPSRGGQPCSGFAVRACVGGGRLSCTGTAERAAAERSPLGHTDMDASYEGACFDDPAKAHKCGLLKAALRLRGKHDAVWASFCRAGTPEHVHCAKTCHRCLTGREKLRLRARAARAAQTQEVLEMNTCEDSTEGEYGARCPLLAMALGTPGAAAARIRADSCQPHRGTDYKYCRRTCCSLPACATHYCHLSAAGESTTGMNTHAPTPAVTNSPTPSPTPSPSPSPTPIPSAAPTPSAAVNGGWGAYGACSATCGAGVATRHCNNPAPRSGGQLCKLSKVGPGGAASSHGGKGDHGGAHRSHRGLSEVGPCQVKPCPIDGGWTSWSACSASCGAGMQVRSCEDPHPDFGGKHCISKGGRPTLRSETRRCTTRACKINGQWGGWGECSVTCGAGVQQRHCDEPRPQFGGKWCGKPNHRSAKTRRRLNNHDEHIMAEMESDAAWMGGEPASPATAHRADPAQPKTTTRAPVIVGRIRAADLRAFYAKHDASKQKNVELLLSHFTTAQIQATLLAKYGQQVRRTGVTRQTPTTAAAGVISSGGGGFGMPDQRSCDMGPCPVDGKWGGWSTCSHSCGEGVQLRQCTNPAPQHSGRPCAGRAREACNVVARTTNGAILYTSCPMDGGWSNWSPCSASCGGGVQERACDSPAPSNGGRDCGEAGATLSRATSDTCNTQPCVHKQDGGWGKWSRCSVTCGEGVRVRRCDSPQPQHGGAVCKGEGSKRCSGEGAWKHRPCPIDGGFGIWGPCGVSCGGGVSTRQCNSPHPQNGGAYCKGMMRRRCSESPCPQDGGWSVWGRCSRSCGGGVQSRVCGSPLPKFGGRPCVGGSALTGTFPLPPKKYLRGRPTAFTGAQYDMRHCHTQPCSADAVVDGGWSEFGACSSSCGKAGKRKRTCTSPAPRNGGKRCKGNRSLESCGAPACPTKPPRSHYNDDTDDDDNDNGVPGAPPIRRARPATTLAPTNILGRTPVPASRMQVPVAAHFAHDNPELGGPLVRNAPLLDAKDDDDALPGAHDKNRKLPCSADCPVTDVTDKCVEPRCGIRGQICTDGGYICTGSDRWGKRPRHCPKDAALCWAPIMFHGGEGFVPDDGEEIIDCGTQTPAACSANGAGIGELCANLEDLYSTHELCRAALPTTRPPACIARAPCALLTRPRQLSFFAFCYAYPPNRAMVRLQGCCHRLLQFATMLARAAERRALRDHAPLLCEACASARDQVPLTR